MPWWRPSSAPPLPTPPPPLSDPIPNTLQCPSPSQLSVSPANRDYFDSIPNQIFPTSCIPNTRTDIPGPKNITVTSQTPTPPDFTPPLLPTTVNLPLPQTRPFRFSLEYSDEEIRAPVELLAAHLWQCDTEPWTESWLEEAHFRLQALLAKTQNTNFSEYPNLFRNNDEEELVGRQSWRTVTHGRPDRYQPRNGRTARSTSVTTLPLPAALFWGLQTGFGLQPSFGPDRTREAVARAIRLRNAFIHSLTEADLMVATYATADTSWDDEEKENQEEELTRNSHSSSSSCRLPISLTGRQPPPPPTALELSYSNGMVCLGMHKLSSYLWDSSGEGWIEHTRQRLEELQRMIGSSQQVELVRRALLSRRGRLEEAVVVSLKLGPGNKKDSRVSNEERYSVAVVRAGKLRESFLRVVERVTEKEIEEWAE